MQEYSTYITQLVDHLQDGKLFTVESIAMAVADEYELSISHAKAITNNHLKRMADLQKIDRIQKGIYYKAKKTVFGKTRPNLDQYAVQFLTTQGENVIGYVTGAAFMNRIGLTTLIPREIEIVTNQYRRVLPDGCHVIAKRPVVPVTSDNYKYFQLLDTIAAIDTEHVDAENPNDSIRAAARQQQIEPFELIVHARKHYSTKTLLRAVDIFTEGTNETARR